MLADTGLLLYQADVLVDSPVPYRPPPTVKLFSNGAKGMSVLGFSEGRFIGSPEAISQRKPEVSNCPGPPS